MNLLSNVVQNEAPQFVDLGILAIKKLNKSGVLGTTATIIRRPTDGSHWTDLDHVFGEATAVGMSAARSDQDYRYKNYFDIWRGNQEFERQTISMNQPPLDSTPIGTNTTNAAMSQLYSATIGKRRQTPRH